MKIIDAVWEKRNLGVHAFEVQVEGKDSFEEFIREEKEALDQGAEYIVVKAPVNLPDFLWKLPEADYTFIEADLSISLQKKNYEIPPFIARLDRNVEVVQVTNKIEIEKLLSKYKDNLFDTDRISIDPHFSKDLSANRYLCWTQDMLDKGCKLFEICIKDKKVGFFIVKQMNEKVAYPVLAGMYSEYKGKGLGALLIKKCIETIWELGYEKINTSVVSNNLSIIKIHLCFGFEINDLFYTYVKHLKI